MGEKLCAEEEFGVRTRSSKREQEKHTFAGWECQFARYKVATFASACTYTPLVLCQPDNLRNAEWCSSRLIAGQDCGLYWKLGVSSWLGARW